MNCTKGTVDVSKFSKSMPIIGLYIAGAAFLCIIQMARDLVSGFKSKQIWIPAKHFSIDAASLTIIGVAIKLSVDLNSPMPSQIDQLAKLSTSAFICTVLANMLPSLGKLEQGELLANTIALSILIITSIVNLCIQLGTGVIHAFRAAHIFMIVCMLWIFFIIIGMLDDLPYTKNGLKLMFENLHKQALKESFSNRNGNTKESMKIKEYLMSFSMMAQSCCPHFIWSRSNWCTGAMVFGLMPASALFFVLFATVIRKGKMVGLKTCSGESDYGWSVLQILITQATAVVISSVALVCRRTYIIKSESPDSASTLASRMVGPTSPLSNKESHEEEAPMGSLMKLVSWNNLKDTVTNVKQQSCGSKLEDIDVCTSSNPYFVHLKRETGSIDFMVESCSRVTSKYIDAGKTEPKHLICLLENYLSNDFGGVFSFESVSDQIPPLGSSDGHPPNCWELPVLTLTCIATAIPNIEKNSKELLRASVIEGLVYVKLVEKNLNAIHDLVKIQRAANLVRTNLDDDSKQWFAIDLEDLAHNNKCPKEVLSSLATSSKKMFLESYNQVKEPKDYDPLTLSRFTRRSVAAHSMYKICQTMMQDFQNEDSNLDLLSHVIFEKLRKTIADILGACFTNLGQCILAECKKSTIEKSRETAFRMLRVFGETERIMVILEGRKIPELSDEKRAFIDEWRSHPLSPQSEEQPETMSNKLDIV